MKVWVIAEGRLRDAALRDVADRYLERLRRYLGVTEVEARDATGLERAVPRGARVVALDVDGEELSSEAFSRRLQAWLGDGQGQVAFVIGGADGLPASLRSRAEHRLSLSRLTLPHRLARVVLLEQIYRAMTIARGEPYAREG